MADIPAEPMTLAEATGHLRRLYIGDDHLGFARAMDELQGQGFDVYYYLEKPYKWAREYQAWVNAGFPRSGSTLAGPTGPT